MPETQSPNLEERNSVEELEKRMLKELTPTLREDPSLFYRFLKARDFDVDKAEKMLRKHIIWRKAQQVDTFLKEFKPKEVFQKYAEPSLLGVDKDGDLVSYNPTGRITTVDVLKCLKFNDYMKHWVWFSEKSLSQLKEVKGDVNGRLTLIIDLEELEFANATSKQSVESFLFFTHLYQDNYPERLKSVYVINAPAYCMFILNIVKAVMSNVTIRKIQVFGYSGWKEALLQAIDAEVLPGFLGGNRTDPDGDPFCKTIISFCGRIPERYYLSKQERYFNNSKEVENVTVYAKEKKEVQVMIDEVHSLIQWRILVKGKDIGFGLFHEKSGSDRKEVIPISKIGTPDGTEENYHTCEFSGKYIFIFDNSYSWFSSKEIRYFISVNPPDCSDKQ